MNDLIRVALVGIGKIAADQHIPTINRSDEFELTCLVSSSWKDFGVPVFKTLDDALATVPALDAVVLCTPPVVREELARKAFSAGCALMVEKPPADTVATAERISTLAQEFGRTAFASWHSRFARMVPSAVEWSSHRNVVSGRIVWHEDVRKWHPGQHWLWQPGGFGVFDPGINALSILTLLVPGPLEVQSAHFFVPANSHTPIALEMLLEGCGAIYSVSLDFRASGEETWQIELTDDSGNSMQLNQGGAQLSGDDVAPKADSLSEYDRLYRRFASLIREGVGEFDLSPLKIIEDAEKLASIETVEPIFN